MSSAKLKIWDQTIGYLFWDERNQSTLFEIDESYLEQSFNLAPILHPDKTQSLNGNDYPKQFKGMIPSFNDSLPDSFGNIVFKEWLEQMNLDQSKMNPVEQLLYVGKRGIGALEYEVGKEIPNAMQSLDLNELADISNKILERKYAQEDFIEDPQSLKNILSIGSSVGGAQAKILMAEAKDGHLMAGDILHPVPMDYYIVKLSHDPQNTWYREKNYVEFVYNEIARAIGIHVADSKLIQDEDRAHFASKRFDRVANQKLHLQTVNALTGFWGRSTAFGYKDIFKVIEYLKLPYPNTEQLYKQMLFNVLLSNKDDHTKNFSFIMDHQAKWSLSPAYDLTFPRDPYVSFQSLHQIHINGKTKDIDRADIIAVAKLAGIRNFNQLIDQAIEGAASFRKRMKAYPVSSKTIGLIEKAINQSIARMS